MEVFFGDEAVFEGDLRPRQRWVKRGSRPAQGYYGGHVRQNVIGAVSPASGQLVSLIAPHCVTEVLSSLSRHDGQRGSRAERKTALSRAR